MNLNWDGQRYSRKNLKRGPIYFRGNFRNFILSLKSVWGKVPWNSGTRRGVFSAETIANDRFYFSGNTSKNQGSETKF